MVIVKKMYLLRFRLLELSKKNRWSKKHRETGNNIRIRFVENH